MSQEENSANQSSGSGLSSAIIAFLRAVLRLLVVVTILLGVAALIYWGVPQIYQSFMVPVEDNTIAIRVLETRQDYAEELFAQQNDEFSRRLDNLELEMDASSGAIDELQVGLGNVQTAATQQQSRLDELAGIQEMLETQSSELDDLSGQLRQLADDVSSQGSALEALQATPESPDIDPLVLFDQRLVLLKVMDQLTMARLSLLEGGSDGSLEYITEARNHLMSLQPDLMDFQKEWLTGMVFQVNLALFSLPDEPGLAYQQLLTSWRLVSQGLPTSEEQAQEMEIEPDFLDSQVESLEDTPTSTVTEPVGEEDETLQTPTPTPVDEGATPTPTPAPTEE